LLGLRRKKNSTGKNEEKEAIKFHKK